MKRRVFVLGALGAAVGLAWGPALAEPARRGFNLRSLADTLAQAGLDGAEAHPGLTVTVPELAENGGVVPVEVASAIPETRELLIVVDKNPSPLAAAFAFSGKALPFVSTNLKMGESSPVRAYARTASGRVYVASASVRVTVGGCGG